MSKIFVIVVTYNGVEWIEQCLNSLIPSTVPINSIVVDNCSLDETVFLIKEKFQKTHLVENSVNYGYGKANNQGIEIALREGADYIILLNQDAWIEPDTIEKLIDVSIKHPEYGVLSPLQLYSPTGDLDYMFRKYLMNKEINNLTELNKKEIIEIPFVNAAIWLLPVRTVNEIGGFDPIFPHYGEDNDFIRRVHYRKYKVGVVPDAIGYHDREQITQRTLLQSQNREMVVVLGKLKDINYSLFYNILSETYHLCYNVIKNTIKFSFVLGKIKIIAYYRALAKWEKIKQHRKLSKLPKAFLEN